MGTKRKTTKSSWVLALLLFIIGIALPVPVPAADIVITGSNVLASKAKFGSQTKVGTAGGTITAGQVLYLTGTNTLNLAIASGTTGTQVVQGIALNNATNGQPISYVVVDPLFTTGGTHVIGDIICLSGTGAGKICKAVDMTSGYTVTVLGVAISTSQINLSPVTSGTTTP